MILPHFGKKYKEKSLHKIKMGDFRAVRGAGRGGEKFERACGR